MDDDVVFVGPPKFNPQLQSAALTQDLVIEAEGIRNRRPRAGEPEFLEDHMVPGKPSEGATHALISLMPGPCAGSRARCRGISNGAEGVL